MKKLLKSLGLIYLIGINILAQSCKDESDTTDFPLSAVIFNSVKDKQVAFTALTHSATNWHWDFGDGQTSTEQNPVHVYAESGYYMATLTASDKNGNTASDDVNLAIAITPYVLLTGGATATNGKTWKLATSHGAGKDYFADANADLTTTDGTPNPLPDGIFGQLGMPDVYPDEYTFYYDGSYKHDVKSDGAAFGGLVYQYVLNGAADVINVNGEDYGLCIANYTPEADATFTYTASEDLTIASVYGENGQVTYKNVSTLDFSGTEFIGFRDYQRKVIIKKITDTSMQLVLFMAASPGYFPANTNALILSFEVVQ